MTDPSLEPAMRRFDPNKPVTLPGTHCAYCRRPLTPAIRTDDHVVARRFVPQGTLAIGFFLKVKACKTCNGLKSALEDDISLVTMLRDTAGRYATEDPRLHATAERKARGAISPATRRLVAQSYNRIEAKLPIEGGLALNYQGVAMPSVDPERIARLAYLHVQGFQFFESFETARGHGAWIDPARFVMLDYMIEADWGNPVLAYFTDETVGWDLQSFYELADGYFRKIVRKKPGTDLYGWALEWNCRMRIFGLFGDQAERETFLAGRPPIPALYKYGDTTNGFAATEDTPLAEGAADRLFAIGDVQAASGYAAPHWR